MSNNINKESILKILQQQNEQDGNQNIEPSLEGILTQMLLNPNKKSKTITRLKDTSENGVVSENEEGTILNSDGFVEDFKINNIIILDDGTSLDGNIARCETCGGTISPQNLKRCG